MATAESVAIRQAVAAEKQADAWQSIDARLKRIEKAFDIKEGIEAAPDEPETPVDPPAPAPAPAPAPPSAPAAAAPPTPPAGTLKPPVVAPPVITPVK